MVDLVVLIAVLPTLAESCEGGDSVVDDSGVSSAVLEDLLEITLATDQAIVEKLHVVEQAVSSAEISRQHQSSRSFRQRDVLADRLAPQGRYHVAGQPYHL